jgi:hypothetical protein
MKHNFFDCDPYSSPKWKAFTAGMKYGYYLRWFTGEIPPEYLVDAIQNIRATAAAVDEKGKKHVIYLLRLLRKRLKEVRQKVPLAIAA